MKNLYHPHFLWTFADKIRCGFYSGGVASSSDVFFLLLRWIPRNASEWGNGGDGTFLNYYFYLDPVTRILSLGLTQLI